MFMLKQRLSTRIIKFFNTYAFSNLDNNRFMNDWKKFNGT